MAPETGHVGKFLGTGGIPWSVTFNNSAWPSTACDNV